MPIAALRAGLNPRPSRKALARTALKGRTGVRHMAPISLRLTLTIGMPTRAIHTASRHRHGAGPASSAISSAVRLAAGRNGELPVVPAGRRLGKGRAWRATRDRDAESERRTRAHRGRRSPYGGRFSILVFWRAEVAGRLSHVRSRPKRTCGLPGLANANQDRVTVSLQGRMGRNSGLLAYPGAPCVRGIAFLNT